MIIEIDVQCVSWMVMIRLYLNFEYTECNNIHAFDTGLLAAFILSYLHATSNKGYLHIPSSRTPAHNPCLHPWPQKQ